MNSVAVIGAGAWGTALAIQSARAGTAVTLWARDPARAAALARTRENPRLPGHTLPPEIAVIADLPQDDTPKLIAVPLQHLRPIAARLSGPLICCAKGVESATLRLPLEILAELHPQAALAFLTGPNFAGEIAAGLPAASIVATTDPHLATLTTAALATPSFRLYTGADPVGAQLGAAAKNVIAIAAGAAIGAGLGQNARAALITRGLAEIARLTRALGGQAETLMGLSGLGDLLLTCTSETSRNYRFGLALGRGQTPADAQAAISGVVEGVATAPALVARAGDVELPICRAVAAVVTAQLTTAEAQQSLLSRLLPASE